MTRVVFMGSPDFAVPSLRALVDAGYELVTVVTQPDREGGRGRHLLHPPVKVAALGYGIPVLQPASLRGPDVAQDLVVLAPDLIVVAAYGQILRPNVLHIPPHGVINVHASLLPRWRGASPVTAAIVAGDSTTGVSIMLMDEGLDTGPVLATRETPIEDAETGGSLTDRLADIGAELLTETLTRWINGEIEPVPQDDALATYAPRLDKSVGRIEWSEPATLIWRKVRAYTPWPGAFTTYRRESLRIISAWPLPTTVQEPPGTVIELPKDVSIDVPAGQGQPSFAVTTGEGVVLPLRLQRPGRRSLPASEFLHGERSLLGSRFDDTV